MVLATAAIVAAMFLVQFAGIVLHEVLGLGPLDQDALAFALLSVIAVHLAYIGFVRAVERRRPDELSGPGAARELGAGIAVGAGLLAISIGIIAALGHYRVTAVNPVSAIGPALAMSLSAGYIEEVLFRGVLFRIVEESLGTWIALAITSLLFGFAHALNPNATLFSSFAIALEAGILLGAAYVLTRRLWFVIGIHFAWNFCQGGVFGVSVSGLATDGLLESELSGPALLTGGQFGAEASIITLVLGAAAGAWFLVRSARRGRFVAPFWARR